MKKVLSIFVVITLLLSFTVTFTASPIGASVAKAASIRLYKAETPNFSCYNPVPQYGTAGTIANLGWNYLYKMGETIRGYIDTNPSSPWKVELRKTDGTLVDSVNIAAGSSSFSIGTDNVSEDGEYSIVAVVNNTDYALVRVYIQYNITWQSSTIDSNGNWTVSGWITRANGQSVLVPVTVNIAYPDNKLAGNCNVADSSSGQFSVTFPINNYNGDFTVYLRDGYSSSNSDNDAMIYATLDQYEMDNDPQHAVFIPTDGTVQYHNFGTQGDVDWIKFNAEAGKTYTIDTLNLGSNCDTVMTLYAPDGTTFIDFNDDFDSLASRIDFECPQGKSGTYYVKIRHYNYYEYGVGTGYYVRVYPTIKISFSDSDNGNKDFGIVGKDNHITVTVTQNGNPIQGATVHENWNNKDYTTDLNGQVTFDVNTNYSQSIYVSVQINNLKRCYTYFYVLSSDSWNSIIKVKPKDKNGYYLTNFTLMTMNPDSGWWWWWNGYSNTKELPIRAGDNDIVIVSKSDWNSNDIGYYMIKPASTTSLGETTVPFDASTDTVTLNLTGELDNNPFTNASVELKNENFNYDAYLTQGYTNSSGSQEVYVTPGTYTAVLTQDNWDGATPDVVLMDTGINVSSDTSHTISYTSSRLGTLNRHAYDGNNNEIEHYIEGFVNNCHIGTTSTGEPMLLVPGAYQWTYEESTIYDPDWSNHWEYNFIPTETTNVTAGSSYTIKFGGPLTATVTPDKDSYAPESSVNIKVNYKDAYGHYLDQISHYSNSSSTSSPGTYSSKIRNKYKGQLYYNVYNPVYSKSINHHFLHSNVNLYTKQVGSSIVSPQVAMSSGWTYPNIHLTVKDPNGNAIVDKNNLDFWYMRNYGYTFTLSSNASSGTYAATATIDVGPYNNTDSLTGTKILTVTNSCTFTPLFPQSDSEISTIMAGGTFIRYYELKNNTGNPLVGATVTYTTLKNLTATAQTDSNGIVALKFDTTNLVTGSYHIAPVQSVTLCGNTFSFSNAPSFGYQIVPHTYSTNWIIGTDLTGKEGVGDGVGVFVEGGTSGGLTISYKKYDSKKNFNDSLILDRGNTAKAGGGVDAGLGKGTFLGIKANIASAEAGLLFKIFHSLGAYFDAPANSDDDEKITQSVFFIGGVANVASVGNPIVVSILDHLESHFESNYINKITGGMGTELYANAGLGNFNLGVTKSDSNINAGGSISILSGSVSLAGAMGVTDYPLDNELGFINKLSFDSAMDLFSVALKSDSNPSDKIGSLKNILSATKDVTIETIYDKDTKDFKRCVITFVGDVSDHKQGIEFIIPKDKISAFYSEITKLTNIAQFLNHNHGISISSTDAVDLLMSVLKKVSVIGITYREVMFEDKTPTSIPMELGINIAGNQIALGLTPTFGRYNSYIMKEGIASLKYGLLPTAVYPDTDSIHQPAAAITTLVSQMFSPLPDILKNTWNTVKKTVSNVASTVIQIQAKEYSVIYGAANMVIKAGTSILSSNHPSASSPSSSDQTITLASTVMEAPSSSSSSAISPNMVEQTNNDYNFIVGGLYTFQPEDATLSQAATIAVSYTEDAVNGRDESRFKLYRFDKDENAWIIVPSTFDASNKSFTGTTTKLGEFCIGYDVTPPQYELLNVQQNNNSVYVYKNNTPQIIIKITDQGSGVASSSIVAKIDNNPVQYSYDKNEGTLTLQYGDALPTGNHTIYVSASDTTGNSSNEEFSIAVETPPSVPTLTLVSADASSVALSWATPTAGTSALDHYELYKAIPDEGKDFTLIATIPIGTNTYTDSDIQYPKDHIYYILRAVDTSGNFSSSQPLVAQPILPPSSPASLTATPSNSQITLSWQPSTQGTYPIAGYAIYRGITPGGESTTPIATVTANTTTYTDASVTSGTTYYYYVVAFDNQSPPNYSEPSNEVSTTPGSSTASLTLHFTANKFNLVSFPFTVSSQDIPNFIKAYTFDWTHFWTTPTTFEPGKGYWIKVSQNEDVTLTGTPSTTNTTITITPGKFNLIGNPFNTPINISQLNTINNNHIIAIYTFDWTHFWQLWTPNTTQNFTTLQPGKAYWIKFDSNAPTTFTIPMP